jgi:protein TonB
MKHFLVALALLVSACASTTPNNGVTPPAVLRSTEPDFPMALFSERVSGLEVDIEGTVDTNGTLSDARVVRSPDPRLDQAAMDAVQSWRFRPAMMNGTPVEATYRVTVRFRSPR